MQWLLVEDDAMSRELWSLLLEAEGNEVQVADSGEAALALLESGAREAPPEVLLVDMQLPGICGAALAAALRTICGPATLLLAMSASEPKHEARAGYDGFLRKPFNMETLEAAVAGRCSSTIAVQAAEAAAPEVLDEAVYAKLLCAMPAGKVAELYLLGLADARGRIERMRAAAAAGDDAAFRTAAHAIKGGCGMIGATELKELAAGMEEHGLTCAAGISAITASLDRFAAACARLEGMLVTRRTVI